MSQSLAKNLIHLVFSTKHRQPFLSDAKKSSSKWLKTQSPGLSSFSWQGGFGAFSVSESNAPAVRQYIANQAEHHKKVCFQDEFKSLLTKPGIEFDERYLWD